MDELDLTDFFTTKPQAVDFSARLSDVSAGLYETDMNLENKLQQEFGIKRKNKFMTLLRENNIPLDSNTELNKFISKIKQTISDMPSATLTLAVEPDENILSGISDWFLLNLEKQVLLETKVDPQIIAGAIIDYQGKHFDASIKHVFENIYKHSGDNKGQSNPHQATESDTDSSSKLKTVQQSQKQS